MQVLVKIFSSGGVFSTPAGVLLDAAQQAAEFASVLPRGSVISISNAFAQHNMAYATVWYRRDELSATDSDNSLEANNSVDESEIQDWINQPDADNDVGR